MSKRIYVIRRLTEEVQDYEVEAESLEQAMESTWDDWKEVGKSEIVDARIISIGER